MTALALIYTASLIALCLCVRCARPGYEADDGFHMGEPPASHGSNFSTRFHEAGIAQP